MYTRYGERKDLNTLDVFSVLMVPPGVGVVRVGDSLPSV